MWKKLLASLDNHSEGYSARKLTALWLVVLITYLHYKFVDITNSLDFHIVDVCAVLIALGIVTAEQVIKFKNGDKSDPPKPDSV